ncbi:MAG: tetratricopeptide repeat protein [Cyanobacteria bacterium SZAS-4]|nr:tetratricopeptide repeat protein [Cyanobacteria bacterium SZAS-4]
MPPLLTGEIEETTGLYDALTGVMDIDISCGVLRIASNNFIGLVGISSSNLIVGAVTKDENAGKLTDAEAVDRILTITDGTFEYYEVPQKELSRLDQNLGLNISELLAKHGTGHTDDGSEEAGKEGEGFISPGESSHEIIEEQSSPIDEESAQESVDETAEVIPEEVPAAANDIEDAETGELSEKPPAFDVGALDAIPSPVDKSALDAIPSPVDKSALDAIPSPVDKSALDAIPSPIDKSALDAIPSPIDKSALDAIPAPSVKSPAPSTGSILSKFKEKKPALDQSAENGQPSTDGAEAPTAESKPFNPATDELQINAAATVERIKKFRRPEAELAAEAEKAQRDKFTSSRKPKDDIDSGAAGDADSKRIRPVAQQAKPTAESKGSSKTQISPKVLVGVGVVSALAVLFLLSRGAIANYFVSSAQSKFDKHDNAGALSSLGPVLFLDPGNAKMHYLQGEIAKAKGDKKQAFEAFQEALQAQPNDPDTLRAYIFAARKVGRYDLVKTATENLMKNDSAAAADGYWFGMLGQAKFNLSEFKSACTDYTQSLKLGLKTPWIYSGRAWAELYSGNPKLAIKDFNVALTFPKDDSWADAQIGKGQALSQLNDPKGALACYNAALQVNQKFGYGYLRRADLYLASNELDKAFADFEQALRLDPKLAAAHVGKSNVYERRSKLDLAIKELTGVAGLDFELAALQIKASQIPQAVASLKKGLAANSKDPNKYMDLAYCYSRLNKPADALDACAKAVELAPTNSAFVAMHGFYNKQNGQRVSARADFDKALSLNPNNAEAHLWRGMLFAESNDMISARQDFATAARLKPSLSAELDALKRSDRKYLTASAYSGGSTQSKALPLIAGDYKTLLAEGYARLKAGRLPTAIQYLASAVKQNPNSAEARRYLAYALGRNGNLTDAIIQYRELVSMGVSNVSDLRALGDLLLKTDQAQEAVDTFKRILVENPRDRDARCRLANAYSALGDLKSGVEVCTQGRQIDPANTAVYDALAEKLKKNEGLQPTKTRLPDAAAPQG